MNQHSMPRRWFSILSGLSGITGVILLGVSFATAVGPPPDATRAELVKFGQQHYTDVLWGAWLQAVGPVFIVLFAFALVHLAGATLRLAGWMTLFGATVLMTVSLIEITYYISALFPDPELDDVNQSQSHLCGPAPLLHRGGSGSVSAPWRCSC